MSAEPSNPRFLAIRRLKRVLRYLPRRATLHRYPIIKYVAPFARRRPYLWKFSRAYMVPALYLGSVLNFLPLIGVRTPLVLCLTLLFRCNLPVTMALQFVTNPLTAGPFYYADYKLGVWILTQLGLNWDFVPLLSLFEDFSLSQLSTCTLLFLRSYLATCLGGTVIGALMGGGFHAGYLWMVARSKKNLLGATPSEASTRVSATDLSKP